MPHWRRQPDCAGCNEDAASAAEARGAEMAACTGVTCTDGGPGPGGAARARDSRAHCDGGLSPAQCTPVRRPRAFALSFARQRASTRASTKAQKLRVARGR